MEWNKAAYEGSALEAANLRSTLYLGYSQNPTGMFFSVILLFSSPMMTSAILIQKDRGAVRPSTFAKMPVSALRH